MALFRLQVFRIREIVLKELNPRNLTRGALPECGPELDDKVLDFVLMP